MPLISILIPAYNVGQFVRECLDSIEKQTFNDFEIVIVNDGSSDNTNDIISEYVAKDTRIKYFEQNNSGVVKTRKLAVQNASGEYAVIVDGDDSIGPEYLQKFVDVIREYVPDVVISGHCQNSPTEKKNILSGLEAGYYDRDRIENKILCKVMEDKYGHSVSPTLWAKCFKLDLYRKWQLNVDDNIKMGDDAVCTIPCIIEANKIVVIDSSEYFYNYNPTSLTHIKKVYSMSDPLLRAKILLNSVDLNRFDFRQQYYRMILRHVFVVACSLFNQKKSFTEKKKQINDFLSNSLISPCVTGSQYAKNYYKGKVMKFILKHKIFLGMLLFAKSRI